MVLPELRSWRLRGVKLKKMSGRLTESGDKNIRSLLGVSVYDNDGNYLRDYAGLPNDQGCYQITGLPASRYKLRVTPSGKADPVVNIEPKN